MVKERMVVRDVVLAGYGSIGKRHLVNLLKRNTIQRIYVVTKQKPCFDSLPRNERIVLRDSFEGIQADIGIVANETHRHVDAAIQMASAGMHLFIEKPLSHTNNKFEVLHSLVEKKRLKIFIGYNLRFLKAFDVIKKIISDKKIGEPYFSQIEVGQYLPTWRPNRDYRTTYSAMRDSGGGVALDLSHEIDYMRYLFGDPCDWKVFKTHVSDLEIETEDIFQGTYLFSNKFICTVHLDYLQKQKKRALRIVGSKGTVDCDFVAKSIQIINESGLSTITDPELFDFNKTYEAELDHFIETVEHGTEPMITLYDAQKINDLIEDHDA